MSDNIDVLKRLALLIRNATAEGENTAERVGRTFVGIIDLLSEISLDKLKELFLRKDQEATCWAGSLRLSFSHPILFRAHWERGLP